MRRIRILLLTSCLLSSIGIFSQNVLNGLSSDFNSYKNSSDTSKFTIGILTTSLLKKYNTDYPFEKNINIYSGFRTNNKHNVLFLRNITIGINCLLLRNIELRNYETTYQGGSITVYIDNKEDLSYIVSPGIFLSKSLYYNDNRQITTFGGELYFNSFNGYYKDLNLKKISYSGLIRMRVNKLLVEIKYSNNIPDRRLVVFDAPKYFSYFTISASMFLVQNKKALVQPYFDFVVYSNKKVKEGNNHSVSIGFLTKIKSFTGDIGFTRWESYSVINSYNYTKIQTDKNNTYRLLLGYKIKNINIKLGGMFTIHYPGSIDLSSLQEGPSKSGLLLLEIDFTIP